MAQTREISEMAADSKEKALRALVTAETFLQAAHREIPGIADQVRRGEHEQVIGGLSQLLGGLDSLVQLAVSVEEIMPGQANDGGRLDLQAMKKDLQALVAGQENSDWQEVGRVIEAEIGPRILVWQDYFRAQVDALRLV